MTEGNASALDGPAPGQRVRVTRSLTIGADELEWRFTTSGGPGGQHANRSQTRVEVRFDVAGSPSLGPRQRAHLVERVGPVARAVAGDSRSQVRNREVALARLCQRLAEGLRSPAARVPTRPSRAAAARRVEDKRRRGTRKRERSGRPDVDS